MIHPLWHRFPMVYQQLEQIQQRLEHVAVLREPQVHALIQQQINAGGKMLRSGLMLMLARLGNPDNDDLITAGAAIEALHLATLVHDDVLDHADLRRGSDTVSAKSGNREAIYAGDFLFAIYFQLLSEQNPATTDLATNARVMKHIFMGEVDQKWSQRATHSKCFRILESHRRQNGSTFCFGNLHWCDDRPTRLY